MGYSFSVDQESYKLSLHMGVEAGVERWLVGVGGKEGSREGERERD